jgi:Indoleamine 2,3-dioxygenase
VVRGPQTPAWLRVEDLDLLGSTAGSREERVFYLTQLEILARCGPVVGAVADAQDAVLDHDPERLAASLERIERALTAVNRVSLAKIDPRPPAPT